MSDKRAADIADYYTQRVQAHGATPQGVDWSGDRAQSGRFDALLHSLALSADSEKFRICDLGCGYGALLTHMRAQGFDNFDYVGVDITEPMIEEALIAFPNDDAVFVVGDAPVESDFVLASGTFHVRQDVSTPEWKEWVDDNLSSMWASATVGIATNFLSMWSDAPRRSEKLFYVEPAEMLDEWRERFGDNISLIHSYGMYEFSISARKPNHHFKE